MCSYKMNFLLILFLGIVAIHADENVLAEYSKGNLQFSANVYKELVKTNSGNFLVCPMSAETAFALAHAGAKGKTANEITTAFGLPSDPAKVQQIYKELSPKLQHTGTYNLSSANKMYLKEKFVIEDNFKDIARKVFNADAQEINFDKKEAAVKEINSWVEEKTYDKIHDLISKDDIDEFTRLIIINAMYFKANWVHEFYDGSTKKRNFYLNAKDTVEVDMMEITEHFGYHECENTNAKYLEMGFVGTDIKMTIILPNQKDGLVHLEKNIEKVFEVPKYQYPRVHVRLPKFEMGSKIDFVPILKKFGIEEAFKGTADFTGIYDNPDENLYITKVLQKTFIKVEEKGTTAAAATAIIFGVTFSAQIPPREPPKEFFVEHPFIYVLRSPEGVMFVGRYVNANDN